MKVKRSDGSDDDTKTILTDELRGTDLNFELSAASIVEWPLAQPLVCGHG